MAYLSPVTYPSPGTYPVASTDGTAGVYPPALTAYVDAFPTPRVRIIFTSLDPNCVTVTIYRQATARMMPVRGGINLPVAGGVGVVDLEVPFGVPCVYIAQMFDVDGVFIGTTGTGQITVPCPDTWVQNPFNPAGAIRCRVGIDTGQTVQAGVTLTPVYPSGRRSGIGIGGQRYGIPNVPITLYTDTLSDAVALDGMFGSVNGDLGLPPFLVIRLAGPIAARIQLPAPLIIGVSQPTRTLINAAAGGAKTAWNVSGPELDPPAASLAQAVYSRNDMDAAFATRNSRDVTYLTRLAMDTDYRYAGAAGGGSPDTTVGTPTTTTTDTTTYGAGDYGVGDYGA